MKQLTFFDCEEKPKLFGSWTDSLAALVASVSSLSDEEKIAAINQAKEMLHEISPFKDEPVDCVLWVKSDSVKANDYNPNSVAPPEMELLEVSIMNDGYTQPIVTWPREDFREVVDGFHRSRVGKESVVVSKRVNGYLPVVTIRKEQQGKSDRIASTIRHNRARGKHQVDAMSEIVLELKNRNWTNQRIARELGMDEDEILRLCQITGLSHLFSDKDFSRAWEADDAVSDDDFEELTDSLKDDELDVRTANTDDPNRVFHTFDKWECHKAGFYKPSVEGKTKEQCETEYAEFLADDDRFRAGLDKVLSEWVNSCEHYLTNKSMNRIAWLGQAAMCAMTGVPSVFCSGFNLLTEEQQQKANATALEYLNKWMVSRQMESLGYDEAASIGRQVEIY